MHLNLREKRGSSFFWPVNKQTNYVMELLERLKLYIKLYAEPSLNHSLI